ncbi:M28 family peptidase [Hyphobacterium marinum]|uniref:M28 family peptidase n=1 Tax=Hyphobacterium marinum TaxID=3116574 RepID=A0ABU7LZ72_9PROT|nr:M28 family peptidase [Hyphobacterium sp. Y6023]MEE2566856.1 M28 family peptidase [Hyphobacterium sp. Y6023]
MTRMIAVSLAAFAFAAPATADDFDTAYNAITGENIAADVAVLASDEFEGRGPGGRGERLTIDYIASRFEEAGAGPAFDDSYFQPFGIAEYVKRNTADFDLSGPSGTLGLALASDYVLFAGQPGERLELTDSTVVFGGFGITAPEEDWDDYAGLDLTGRTLVLFRGDPGTATNDETLFDGNALTVHGLVGTKFETAAAQGASAVILIHTEQSAGYPWATLSSGGVGGTQYFLTEDDGDHLTMVAHVSEEAGRRIFDAAGLDFDTVYTEAATRGFRAIESELTASGTLEGQVSLAETNNVVGRITGSEAPEECVIYTAHWDHMGINPLAPTDDTIFNGALDNATGTAMLINLARAYGSLDTNPRRSVYFFATAAEERGFLGTEHYISDPACALADTVAVFNMDAHFPFADHWQAMTVPGLGTSELEDILGDAAARLGRELQEDSNPAAGGFFRSDHWPFIKVGVPGIYAVGSPNEAQVEADPDILPRFAAYMTGGYHHAADEYDAEAWLMGGIEGDARIYFEAGHSVANDDRYPNFYLDTPYRRLRDAMLR